MVIGTKSSTLSITRQKMDSGFLTWLCIQWLFNQDYLACVLFHFLGSIFLFSRRTFKSSFFLSKIFWWLSSFMFTVSLFYSWPYIIFCGFYLRINLPNANFIFSRMLWFVFVKWANVFQLLSYWLYIPAPGMLFLDIVGIGMQMDRSVSYSKVSSKYEI